MNEFTIGICAYNEEKNIRNLLNLLLRSKFILKLKEILIVAGGTDRTIEIIKKIKRKKRKIKLFVESKRKGKASAVNLIMKNASADIIVFISADNIPSKESINFLLKNFEEKRVGGIGGRPIPLNKEKNLVSYIGKLIWKLHHRICVKSPKLSGELFAIRNGILREIPHNIVNDDGYIEAMIKKNYLIKYEANAITYMYTPSSISKLLKQRRRIASGYIQLKKMKLDVSIPIRDVIKEVLKIMIENPNEIPKIFLAILIEISANILAYIDTSLGYLPYCWERVT